MSVLKRSFRTGTESGESFATEGGFGQAHAATVILGSVVNSLGALYLSRYRVSPDRR